MSTESSKRRRSHRSRPSAGDAAIRPAQRPVRQLVHGRQLVCRAYRREDGRWDIEGRLADVKTRDVQRDGMHVAAGEPYRALALEVTVDSTHTIRDARVEVDVRAAGSAARARRQPARRSRDDGSTRPSPPRRRHASCAPRTARISPNCSGR